MVGQDAIGLQLISPIVPPQYCSSRAKLAHLNYGRFDSFFDFKIVLGLTSTFLIYKEFLFEECYFAK